jgi:hypothetical protein
VLPLRGNEKESPMNKAVFIGICQKTGKDQESQKPYWSCTTQVSIFMSLRRHDLPFRRH